jgi:L-alanine-DL-glutamate epimerase-like enolase superfamily enzyme
MMSGPNQISIATIETRVFRVPIANPVQTSFGTMHSRPAVLVRATDTTGAEGWGEVWCNFPSVGAEHRARFIRETLAPMLQGRGFASPEDIWRSASHALEVLAIQSGEPGPVAQCLAGIDTALWDLAARAQGLPLYRYLGATDAVKNVPVYASGLNPDRPEQLAAIKKAEGHRAFKLKVGFGRERDLANLAALRKTLGDDATLMVDANQAWDLDDALAMSHAIAPFRPMWLEEPMRADAPTDAWQQLAQNSPLPLAAGENMRGQEFEAAVAAGWVKILQPDVGKWGGFSGCVPVGRMALATGKRLCPHWLGGGIGLVASLHLLAALGGDGLVEVDSNPNPLRELMAAPFPALADGHMEMPQAPGLGVGPDLAALGAFEVAV